jgi:hypothetical protein
MTVYYTAEIADSVAPATTISISEKSFMAPRISGDPFSFAVSGDNRPAYDTVIQPAAWGTIVTQMMTEDLDLALTVGDIIFGMPDTHAQNVARYEGYFAITSQLTYSVPLYVAVGNHERIAYPAGRTAYEQEFTLPENNGADAATDGELYYSFDHGDTHFVSLSTEIPGEEGMVINDQKAWLENDLAGNTNPWVVVFMHRPMFNGMHADDPWINILNVAGQQNKAAIHDLFILHDVDIVFAGHEHHYSHHVEDDIHYVIAGGGGASLSAPLPLGEGDVFAAAAYHHVKVDETEGLLSINVIDSVDSVLESFILGEPDLSLELNGAYWDSYMDYVLRELTVDFTLTNSGEGAAVGTELVYLVATSDVTTVTSIPFVFGDIVEDGTIDASFSFRVPQGISSFSAVAYATCEDLDGNVYVLPGPAPS